MGAPQSRQGTHVPWSAMIVPMGAVAATAPKGPGQDSMRNWSRVNCVPHSRQRIRLRMRWNSSAYSLIGFSAFVGKMAPGDLHNVYVNLSNTGSLGTVAGMRLWVGAAPVTTLTNGVAVGEGLTARISSCTLPWILATGACPGLTTIELAATAISTMNSAATARALANVPALAATTGKVAHVQVSLGLVGTEKSINGIPPVRTIQGQASTLTFSFTVQQRLGIKTNQ